jgi:cytoskeletal protein CcmA (bactofilin family)
VGDLSGDENIHVEGRLSGKIRVAGEVSVGSGGQVEGDIHARTVVVSGRVRGEIVAEERVELAASASVEGTVHAPKIVIAEGARLEGNVAMSAGSGSALEETEG